MTGPTQNDWITSVTQTLDILGDTAAIQAITIRVVRPSEASWWHEAEVVYEDGSKTRVI